MFFSAVKLTSASTTEVDSKRQEIKETVEGMKANAGLTQLYVLGPSSVSWYGCVLLSALCLAVICRLMQTPGLVLSVV